MTPARQLDVRGSGAAWAVILDGRAVATGYTTRDAALTRRDNLARRMARAAQPARPCLCCGEPIRPEHKHHRLCQLCRQGG